MLGQRLRRWTNIEPTLDKCTMFERKSSCPANARHLYEIYAMSAQRLRRILSVCLQVGDQVLTHRCRSSIYELAVI